MFKLLGLFLKNVKNFLGISLAVFIGTAIAAVAVEQFHRFLGY